LRGFDRSKREVAVFRLIVTLLALTLGASNAFAASRWNGAGWYQVSDDPDRIQIIAGPFSDEGTCKATLPADNADFEYYCNYLEARPSWDV
jgi:hypothetical protein